ncbi:hypothetical protein VQ042_14595, partial [Aurantimonas sp. A2-1-M11]|uniref:hypothetical protein n=1 Tax=Aurantimonas sp. A2-1-M11 TaxID=3113712 RepID=UPI002F931031
QEFVEIMQFGIAGARIIKPFPAGDEFFHGILPTAKIRRPSEESIANASEQSDYKNFQMRFPCRTMSSVPIAGTRTQRPGRRMLRPGRRIG